MKKSIGFKSTFLTGCVFLLAVIAISDSCTKSTDYNSGMGNTTGSGTGAKGGPGTNEVWIQGMAFDPATITVAVGTTITWTNKDAIGHTVTFNSGQAETYDSGMISANGTVSHMFNIAGTFTYYCKVHPSMTANVIVK